MRRNRKNNLKKERIIMIASSAFVMAALTMTGVYMKDRANDNIDDGYTLDFGALEEETENQLAGNQPDTDPGESLAEGIDEAEEKLAMLEDMDSQKDLTLAEGNLEDDMDYTPGYDAAVGVEAGSGLVEIPGLTDTPEEAVEEETEDEAASGGASVKRQLHFEEGNGLVRPTAGEVLLPFSMDKSVYFATLDQYKYNPAMLFQAEEGADVTICAEGQVVSVFENEEIGQAVTLDLGNGYQATYGQLKEVQVTENSFVNPGELLGYVAAPTKYYSVEGSNLYFQLTRDGVPVDPEGMFQ